MLFHSVQYFLLLGVTFALYWTVRLYKLPRRLVLFAGSLVFYFAWKGEPLFLFCWIAVVNVVTARAITRAKTLGWRKAFMVMGVTHHLGALCLFKYANMLIGTVGWFAEKLNLSSAPEPVGLVLPIGLSFVSFMAISYIVDVYRGYVHGRNTLFEQLLYLLYFPHVIAGPIIRSRDLLSRMAETPYLKPEDGAVAIFRIAQGVAKKLLLGDLLSVGIIDPVFSNPHQYTAAESLVAAFAYTFQIYFDFSAYSDIALGSSALFGLALPENFNKPFHARNLFEFWNRWHLSLSTWLRDYLYIPLGGNRCSKPKVLRNLMLVMVLGGIWHGADWRFALWGLIHGVLLCGLRIWWWVRGKPEYTKWWQAGLGMLMTFILVMLTRVFFRAPDVPHALELFERMGTFTFGVANVSAQTWVALAVGVGLYYAPISWNKKVCDWFVWAPVPVRAGALVALGLIIARVAQFEAQPYIYFQF